MTVTNTNPALWFASYDLTTDGTTDTYTGSAQDGSGFAISVPTGAAWWTALGVKDPNPAPTPTTIAPLAFMARLTPAEQVTITTAGLQSPQIMLFLLKLVAPGEVDLNDPLFAAGVRAMVGGGLLTADRAAQISNLAVASP